MRTKITSPPSKVGGHPLLGDGVGKVIWGYEVEQTSPSCMRVNSFCSLTDHVQVVTNVMHGNEWQGPHVFDDHRERGQWFKITTWKTTVFDGTYRRMQCGMWSGSERRFSRRWLRFCPSRLRRTSSWSSSSPPSNSSLRT